MFSSATIQQNRALYFLKKLERVVLICHKKPDGDALGAMLALKMALDFLGGKNIKCLSFDPVPNRLSFLPQVEEIKSLDSETEFLQSADLIVALDCELNRTGINSAEISGKMTISFDHHQDNRGSATINVLNVNASSTSEIIYNFLAELPIQLNSEVATCLLTGIFADTGGFQHSNTSAQTLEIASHLISAGARVSPIAQFTTNEKPLSTLRLWGRILARLKHHQKLGLITAVATKKDLQECGAKPEELEGIANYLNAIPDVRATVFISEEDDQSIKGSLRTLQDNVDVSRLASFFGGGGHKKASGFSFPARLNKLESTWQVLPR